MDTVNRHDGDQHRNETRRDFQSHLARRGLVARLAPRSGFKERKRSFRSYQSDGSHDVGKTATHSEYVFPSPKTEGRLVDVKFRFDKAKREAISAFTICVTRQPLAWRTVAPMHSRWLKSSDGRMFGWLCATRTQRTKQSAERLKISPNRLDQVTNR